MKYYEYKDVGAYQDDNMDEVPFYYDGTPIYDAYFYMEATELTKEEYDTLVTTGKSVYHA